MSPKCRPLSRLPARVGKTHRHTSMSFFLYYKRLFRNNKTAKWCLYCIFLGQRNSLLDVSGFSTEGLVFWILFWRDGIYAGRGTVDGGAQAYSKGPAGNVVKAGNTVEGLSGKDEPVVSWFLMFKNHIFLWKFHLPSLEWYWCKHRHPSCPKDLPASPLCHSWLVQKSSSVMNLVGDNAES